ncbi:MAG: prepilin-type N-terminal cleavage/methylation domain-containing protein [Saccharofermentans sp.]|nr:prepilin-type N-terminal cleavage/methylation domain-containing protein [Saccharofermentans sp.]
MKRISKSKKGFSLTEVVLVVAIIVILASAFAIGIADYINTTQDASDKVDESVSEISDNISTKESQLTVWGF